VKEAKPLILEAFRNWVKESQIEAPDETDALSFFYGTLREHQPPLLSFVSREEKWDLVLGWLKQEGLVSQSS
jgi:hypothetical protein